MNFKIVVFSCQQTTDNSQQTFSTEPEPVEGNSSASLREDFKVNKTTRPQVNKF